MRDENGAHPGYPGHPEAPTYPGYLGSPFLHQLPFQPYPLAKHSELKLIPLTRMIRLCKVIDPEQYRTNAETHAERLMQMAYWPNFAICPWDYPCVLVEIPELKQDGHENQCLWRETTVGMLIPAWLETEWGRKIAYPNEPWVNLWT